MLLTSDYVVPMLVGSEADLQLDRITGAPNARTEVFVRTMNLARSGFGTPGRLAPPSAPGSRAWLDGTEELRLRLAPFGWERPEDSTLDLAGFVVSPDRSTAIAMVAGDTSTGLPSYIPQVKYSRGPASTQYVTASMFPDHVPEPYDNLRLLYLLHHMTGHGWRAELSEPGTISGGLVTGWSRRIQIVADGPDRDRAAVDAVPAEDLPAPSVRWRDTA